MTPQSSEGEYKCLKKVSFPNKDCPRCPCWKRVCRSKKRRLGSEEAAGSPNANTAAKFSNNVQGKQRHFSRSSMQIYRAPPPSLRQIFHWLSAGLCRSLFCVQPVSDPLEPKHFPTVYICHLSSAKPQSATIGLGGINHS